MFIYLLLCKLNKNKGDEMSSDARKRANKKYAENNYKRIAVNFRREHLEALEEYKKKNNTESDSGILKAAVLYCMEKNIDLKDYIK